MNREELLALPLEKFILEATKQNELPPEGGMWRSPLWEFTRWIKARREFLRLDAYTIAGLIQRMLAPSTPEGNDPWEHHFGGLPGIDDPRAEFIDTWDKVKTPANMDALTVAWQEALRLPLRPRRPYSAKHCKLLSLAGHLQRSRPDQTIALPVERIAQILECDRKSVSRYLKFSIKEKLLVKVSDCVPHHRAAEFTFDVGRFDWTTGEEAK